MSLRSYLPVCVGAILGGVVGATGLYTWLQLNPPAPATVSTGAEQPDPSRTRTPASSGADDNQLESPPYRGLDANLYMQTAAEYQACCLQAYELAVERLTAKLASRKGDGKPAAVVFDLDETVLDNGGFQAEQTLHRRKFDQSLWDKWEEQGGDRVRLVPGAKEFIDKLQPLKVVPVYISNRQDKFIKQNAAVLERLGIGVPGDRLLLASGSSDKTARRAKVREKYDVLLWVGDNLRDFDESFKFDKAEGVSGRKAVVSRERTRFGDDWIILPNPAYGEWTKVFGHSPDDAKLLFPTGK